ncbi:UNVERIFIED_CONTAM: hypothetical protein K2H54_049748 [Gekko kuhli]
MVTWMKDLGYTIDRDKWAEIWKSLKYMRASNYKEKIGQSIHLAKPLLPKPASVCIPRLTDLPSFQWLALVSPCPQPPNSFQNFQLWYSLPTTIHLISFITVDSISPDPTAGNFSWNS